MNRPADVGIRKWRAYFSAYATLPGDNYSSLMKAVTKLSRAWYCCLQQWFSLFAKGMTEKINQFRYGAQSL